MLKPVSVFWNLLFAPTAQKALHDVQISRPFGSALLAACEKKGTTAALEDIEGSQTDLYPTDAPPAILEEEAIGELDTGALSIDVWVVPLSEGAWVLPAVGQPPPGARRMTLVTHDDHSMIDGLMAKLHEE